MAKLLKLRRGTTSQHSSFTGAEGEVTVDTDKETLVVHNGSTAGGFALARADSPDNQQVRFGTDNDLKIYHNGSHGYIDNATGETRIRGAYVKIRDIDSGESMATFDDDGSVDLYYDGVKKFATIAAGVEVDGKIGFNNITGETIGLSDDQRIRMGASNDLLIYHDGSSTNLIKSSAGNTLGIHAATTWFRNAANSETTAKFIEDGAVELYHNDSKKIETTSGGAKVTGELEITSHLEMGDGDIIKLGDSDDLQLYHDGSHSHLTDGGTGDLKITANDLRLNGNNGSIKNYAEGETFLAWTNNGAVELYHDNTKKLETTSGGIDVTGSGAFTSHIDINADDSKLRIGASNDLEIYHNGTDTYIDNVTGNLFLRAASTEKGIAIVPNGAVELYHDNTKKVETLSTGIKITSGEADIQLSSTGPSGLWRILGSTGGSTHRFRIYDSTNSREPFYIDNAGDITISGDIKVANTQGIDFSATGDATGKTNELFADYEEGTWTPSLTFNNNTFTYHADTGGSYTKVGKLVTCFGVVRLTARSGSNHLILGGLPFNAGDHSSGDSQYEGGVVTTHIDNSAAATHGPIGQLSSSNSSMYLYHQLSSGNGSALNGDEIDATLRWHFIVQYMSA